MNRDATPAEIRLELARAIFAYGEKPTQENARVVRDLLERFERCVECYASIAAYDRGRYY